MGRPRPPGAVRSRAARLVGLGLIGAILTLAAGYVLLPVATRIGIAVLDLFVSAAIWLVAAAAESQDRSAILIAVGRAMLRALTSPGALKVFSAVALVGAAALSALHRLLDREVDSDKEETSR